MPALIDIELFDNTLGQWLLAASLAVGVWVALSLVLRFVRGRLSASIGSGGV